MAIVVSALVTAAATLVASVALRAVVAGPSASPLRWRAIGRLDTLDTVGSGSMTSWLGELRATIGDAVNAGRRVDRDVPALAEAIARELRAGAGVQTAVLAGADQTSGRLRADRPWIQHRLAAGAPVGETLRVWADRRRSQELGQLAAVISLGIELGGSLAPALDGLAGGIADRLAAAGEARAQSSQARASALFLIVSPIVFTAAASSFDPRHAEFLFGTPLGWVCVAVALGLDGLGAWWMWRLTERVG